MAEQSADFERETWGVLVLRAAAESVRKLNGALPSEVDRSELEAEVVHRIIRRYPNRPEGDVDLSSYAGQVARRLCIDRARRSRVGRAALDARGGGPATTEDIAAATADDESHRATLAIRELISHLPTEERTVLTLRIDEAATIEAIGAALGVSVPTAWRRIQGALEHLRLAIQDQCSKDLEFRDRLNRLGYSP